MGRNAVHPGILDPQLLLKEGDLVVPAVDLGLQPNLTILTEGSPGEQGREGVVAESQDMEDGRPDAALPAAGRGSVGGIGASVKIPCQESHGTCKLLRHRQFTGQGVSTQFAGPVHPIRSGAKSL